MNIPHPGELRHRIDILSVVNTVNRNGYPVESETLIGNVWAGIVSDASRYFNGAGADNAEKILCFVIRWRNDIREGMWVKYNDERYLITEVFEYDHKKRYMKLTAKRTEGVH